MYRRGQNCWDPSVNGGGDHGGHRNEFGLTKVIINGSVNVGQ